jgi:tetratricopeptide (TPR) repeat protein
LRFDAGDMAGAVADFTQAEASARVSADSVGVVRALSNIAVARLWSGDLDGVLALFAEALAQRERLGDTHGAQHTKVGMANALMYLGRIDEALTIADEVANERQAEPRLRVYGLDTRAVALLTAGEPESALRAADQALALARRHTPAIVTLVEVHVAVCQLVLGDPEPARHLVRGNADTHTFEDELDLMFLRAALAHAERDHDAMASAAADLSAWIEARGFELHSGTPTRLLAAFERQVPLRELPRLMWCAHDRGGVAHYAHGLT